ncbi:MAG: type III secretion system chaperone [Gammaproteobacteria bacterium]|nr:type III secretion system chaperone [Gammaproteobacteria bacterium]MDE0282992.1 type III secretion system chaperone [Gammaproteobacteria bacterium]MDE0510669.1 type III secretion system chaperone [Gammaproteobacteria bacterium]
MTEREQTLIQVAGAVAQLVGIPELGFDDDDCICLEFEDVTCALVAAEDRLILHADLAPLSGVSEREDVYRALLRLNADLTFSDGAVAVATDRDADSIALSCIIKPLHAPEADLLEAIMTRFLELAQDVQLYLRQFSVTEQAQQEFSGAGLRV